MLFEKPSTLPLADSGRDKSVQAGWDASKCSSSTGCCPTLRNVTLIVRASPWKSFVGTSSRSISIRGCGGRTRARRGNRSRREGWSGRAGVGVDHRSSRDSVVGKRPLNRYEIDLIKIEPSLWAGIGMKTCGLPCQPFRSR